MLSVSESEVNNSIVELGGNEGSGSLDGDLFIVYIPAGHPQTIGYCEANDFEHAGGEAHVMRTCRCIARILLR